MAQTIDQIRSDILSRTEVVRHELSQLETLLSAMDGKTQAVSTTESDRKARSPRPKARRSKARR